MADESANAKVPPAAAALIEGFPDPVVLIQGNRRVLAANRAARDIMQINMIGRDLAQTVRHPAVLEAVDAVLAGSPHHTADVSLAAPVPRDFTLVVSRLDSRESLGDIAVMLALHDITAAIRAEQMRADFVANVSHELRSPLAALVGLIETLRSTARDDPEARDRFLEIMHGESLRMSRLIDDLLSLSRVEINEHIQPRGGVELKGLLVNIAELLAVRAEARGMTIETDVPDGLSPVAGERDELFQVFQNLIDNAIKYAAQGTVIRVLARPVERMSETGGPGVSVAVMDRGEGIAPDHLPRLTERFYRVDKGRSRSLGGTGLGLAIVKHIVNRHRGRVSIDSRLGEGSTFSVLLPQSPQASAKSAVPEAKPRHET